jgi:hypothetical protein
MADFVPHEGLGPDEDRAWEALVADLEADLPPEGLMDGYSPDPYPGAPLAVTPEKIDDHNAPIDDARREAEGL